MHVRAAGIWHNHTLGNQTLTITQERVQRLAVRLVGLERAPGVLYVFTVQGRGRGTNV